MLQMCRGRSKNRGKQIFSFERNTVAKMIYYVVEIDSDAKINEKQMKVIQ